MGDEQKPEVEEQGIAEQVEGQGFRMGDKVEAAKDVEGQGIRWANESEGAEDAEDTDADKRDSDSDQKPKVEGQPARYGDKK